MLWRAKSTSRVKEGSAATKKSEKREQYVSADATDLVENPAVFADLRVSRQNSDKRCLRLDPIEQVS